MEGHIQGDITRAFIRITSRNFTPAGIGVRIRISGRLGVTCHHEAGGLFRKFEGILNITILPLPTGSAGALVIAVGIGTSRIVLARALSTLIDIVTGRIIGFRGVVAAVGIGSARATGDTYVALDLLIDATKGRVTARVRSRSIVAVGIGSARTTGDTCVALDPLIDATKDFGTSSARGLSVSNEAGWTHTAVATNAVGAHCSFNTVVCVFITLIDVDFAMCSGGADRARTRVARAGFIVCARSAIFTRIRITGSLG